MEIKDKIMEKVLRKEHHRDNFIRCLSVATCPECGHDLYAHGDYFGPSVDFECTNCDFEAENITLCDQIREEEV